MTAKTTKYGEEKGGMTHAHGMSGDRASSPPQTTKTYWETPEEQREIDDAIKEAENLFDAYDEPAFEEGAIGLLYTFVEYAKHIKKYGVPRNAKTN